MSSKRRDRIKFWNFWECPLYIKSGSTVYICYLRRSSQWFKRLCRAVASLTVPGGQEFYSPHFSLKFRSIFPTFPQTFLILFLNLALRVPWLRHWHCAFYSYPILVQFCTSLYRIYTKIILSFVGQPRACETNPSDNACYCVLDDTKDTDNWFLARWHCYEINGTLVDVNTANDNTFVQDLLTSAK